MIDVKGSLKQLLKDKIFWALLIVILIIPLVALISTTDNLVGNAVQNIAFMKGGNELFFEVRNVDGIKSVTAEITEDIKGGQIIFEPDDTIVFDGVAYAKIKVSSEQDGQLGEMKIELKLRKDRMQELKLKKEDVSLYISDRKIETKYKESTELYEFFEVTASEMGEYVIGKAEEKATEPTAEEIVEKTEDKKSEEDKIEEVETAPEEEIIDEDEKAIAGMAIAQEGDSKSISLTPIIVGVIILVVVVVLIIISVHKVKKKKGAVFDHSELREWIHNEWEAGNSPKAITKILKQHTGMKKKELLEKFPELKK